MTTVLTRFMATFMTVICQFHFDDRFTITIFNYYYDAVNSLFVLLLHDYCMFPK